MRLVLTGTYVVQHGVKCPPHIRECGQYGLVFTAVATGTAVNSHHSGVANITSIHCLYLPILCAWPWYDACYILLSHQVHPESAYHFPLLTVSKQDKLLQDKFFTSQKEW